MKKKSNPHVGSDFKDFLAEQLKSPAFRREFEKARLNLSVGATVRRIMRHHKLSVRALAKRMQSSVSQVQRLLDDENVSLETLAKFAAATGKKLSVEIE